MFDDQESEKDGLGGKPRIAYSDTPVHASETRRCVLLIPLGLIAVVAMFYLFTIKEGHSWGDDWSLYVLHAKSIVEGKGYAETPYIHTALYPDIGPSAYPPGLPIILSPVYKWFGLNIIAMKIAVGVFFVATLWVLFWMYRLQLPWPYAAGLIFLLGFQPIFFGFKDEILSDFPFLFFVWATLYAVQRHYDNPGWNRLLGYIPYAVSAGVCMYLAYSVRVVGVLLPASLFLYEFMKWKKLSRFAITAVLVAGILIALQIWLLPDVGRGYVYQSLLKYNTIGGTTTRVIGTITGYLIGMPSYFNNGYSKPIMIALCAIVTLLAGLGLARRIREGITIQEVFLFLYVGALVIVPFPVHRYLFPIIPLYFFYACIGAIDMKSLARGRGWQYAPIIVAGAVVFSYSSMYTTLDYGPIREGIGREESKELFQYIREHTDVDDVVIFRKPRALALLTGRRSSIYPEPSGNPSSWDPIAWKYFQDIGVRYLILAVPRHACCPNEAREVEWLQQFVERCEDRCQKVFSNADFKMYELQGLFQRRTLSSAMRN